jgi:3-oxoacyl-[acyl-carrier-protein] synthase-1
MKRVVVTGLGVVSSIGNNVVEVTQSLRDGKSGIEAVPQYKELGFRSQIAGTLKLNVEELVDRRLMRFMGNGAAYAYLAMKEAIADAGLADKEISHDRTGVVAGSGGPTTGAIVQAALTTKEKGPRRVGPFQVPRAMSSTVSANLATAYKIKGLSYSISSACSTSAHCIGNAVECIQLGKADRMFAGGGEELDWTLSVLFDAMGAMSSKYNDTPATGEPRLRQGPRRLRDRRRRRHPGARGPRSRSRPRRQDLCRGRGLRRHVRRRRHGGAVWRRCRALHEARHRRLPRRGAAQRAGRLH